MFQSKFRPSVAALTVGLLASGVSLAAAQGTGPIPPSASVTIPYAELKLLWAAAQAGAHPKEIAPKLPVDALLRTADYQIQLDDVGRAAVVEASFEASNLSRDWQFVPLVGGRVQIESITPAEAQVVRRDDAYGLFLAPETSTAVVLKLNAGKLEGELGFAPAPATIGKISITGIPDDRSVEIEGAFEAVGSEAGRRLYSLPAKGTALVIKLVPKLAEPPAVVEQQPSLWELGGEIVVQPADAALRFESKLHLRADAGAGQSARLIFPAGCRIGSVSGDELDDWRPARGQDGSQQLQLRWSSEGILDREIIVAWQLGRAALDEKWVLAPPRIEPAKGAEANFLFAVHATPGLELRTDAGELPAAPQQLPNWSAERLGSAEYTTVATKAAPVTLQARWLPRVVTAEAMISSAEFAQELVEQGGILTKAQYSVDHRAATRFVVDLPGEGDILTCRVAGQAVRPVRRAERQLEFALPAPADDKPTVVEFCYADQLAALDPVAGNLKLELPRTDLFIHQLEWTIEIPTRFENTAAEGNVTITASDEPRPNQLKLAKKLCRGEAPAIELYYQRTQ